MDDFRALALALPSAVEVDHFGAPSFRVNGKIFAQLSGDETTGLVKLSKGTQAWALAVHAESVSIEPTWGRFGWTRLAWRSLGTDIIADLLAESWRAVTPKKLHRLLVARDTKRTE